MLFLGLPEKENVVWKKTKCDKQDKKNDKRVNNRDYSLFIS